MCKKPKGFTLIEMLIVVGIIAILAPLMLRGFGIATARSRDARRIGDLKNLQSALETYYNIENSYPDTDYSGLEALLKTKLGVNFKLSQDPSRGATYYYCPGSESVSGAINNYILGAFLEVSPLTDSLTDVSCSGYTCGTNHFYCVGM